MNLKISLKCLGLFLGVLVSLGGCSSHASRLSESARENGVNDGAMAGSIVKMPPKADEDSADFRDRQRRAILKRQQQDFERQERELQDLRRQQIENERLNSL